MRWLLLLGVLAAGCSTHREPWVTVRFNYDPAHPDTINIPRKQPYFDWKSMNGVLPDSLRSHE